MPEPLLVVVPGRRALSAPPAVAATRQALPVLPQALLVPLPLLVVLLLPAVVLALTVTVAGARALTVVVLPKREKFVIWLAPNKKIYENDKRSHSGFLTQI